MLVRIFVAALLAAVPTAPWAADEPYFGIVTILEGDAQVLRAANRLQLVEAARVSAGDIIEMGAAGFMQLELGDRTVIQLGPRTRLLLTSPASRQKGDRSMYALTGWLKLMGARRDKNAAPFDIQTPLFELPAPAGAVILQSGSQAGAVYVETGEARVTERPAGATLVLKTDALFRRKANAKGVLDQPSLRALIAEMPPVFRDSVPARAERLADRQVTLKALPEFVYADVEAWLKAEPPIRRPLMQRWRARSKDGAFRTALVTNLTSHPEWDPILFPEKYLPKPPPEPAAAKAPEISPTREVTR